MEYPLSFSLVETFMEILRPFLSDFSVIIIFVCFKINGINVTQVPLKYARQAVRKAKGVVRLYTKKAPRREVYINYFNYNNKVYLH